MSAETLYQMYTRMAIEALDRGDTEEAARCNKLAQRWYQEAYA